MPGLGRSPGEGNGYPLQYSGLENSMDRALAAYSPWNHKELGTTEQLLQRMNKIHEIRSFIERLWTVKAKE